MPEERMHSSPGDPAPRIPSPVEIERRPGARDLFVVWQGHTRSEGLEVSGRRRLVRPTDDDDGKTEVFRVGGKPVTREEFDRVKGELFGLQKKVGGLPSPDSHPDDEPMRCRCNLLLAVKNTETGEYRLNFDRISIWFRHPATVKCRRCGELVPTIGD